MRGHERPRVRAVCAVWVVSIAALIALGVSAQAGAEASDPPSLSCPPAPQWSQSDVSCSVSGGSSYASAISSDDPSLQWRLGEGSGTVAADASGHGHAGTYNGGHTLGQSGALAGSSDPASDFDGTNGRVNSTYNPFANGGQITIEGWANRDTSTTDDSLFGGNGSAPPRLLISAGSNDVRFRPVPSNGAEQLWTNAWPGTGQWVHWAVVLSESTDTAELFINGASKGTRTVSQAYATTPGSFEAGASGSTNNPFDGRLDEVAVYEHGLSAARIAAHHDAGLGSGFVSQKRTQTNGGVWLSWSSVAGSSFPITAEGTTQVEARVSGNDASVSGSASQTVKIDKSTPTPVLSCPPAPAWSQTDVSCAVTGEDSRYTDAVATDDPSLEWRLGEGSGTSAADASGHGHAGTYDGGHTLGQSGALAGSSDPASDFDGTNGRVNSSYYPFQNGGQITIEGWANRDSQDTDDTLFGGGGSSPPRLLIVAGSNDVRFRPVPSTGAEQVWANAWPGTGQWVHWAVVLSESTDTAELYINGTSLGTRAVSQAYAETPGTFEAGASGSANNPFDGRLDEVAVYEHGLSAARIAAHHDAGRAPSGAAPGFDYRTALGGGAWSAWGPVQGSSVPVTDEGRTHLEARMSDVAGNVASTSETIKIDKADPTPSLDCPPAPEGSTTAVTCTVSGEDSVYSDAIQTDDPSLQWRLGEGSGTVAADASGHGHAGTYNGGHTLGQSGALAGSSDPASDFDGTNGRVNSTYNPFANGGQITIEGWANRDTSTTDDSLFGGNGSAPPRLLISAGSNDVRFRPVPSNGAEQLWTNAWPGTGQWVHWAVVLSESTDTAELFINGASKGTRTVSQAYATTPGSFEAGASGSTNNPFDGRLDEVAVYEHGLSAARIAAHHDAGLGSGVVSQKRTQPNGGVWLSWSSVAGSSSPITAEGTTQVEARVSGNDASVSGSASQTVKIDKSTPTPVLSCPPAPAWSQTDVSCAVTGEDSRYTDAVATDDPSLEWRLGEGSGTSAADASGHGHAGTYDGGHTLGQSGALAGSSDPASDFDGTNGRVNSSYYPFQNGGQITIEGWANRDSQDTDDTLFGGGGSSPPRLLIVAGSNDVRFRPVPSTGAEQVWANAWPGTGQWVHWAVVLSESTDTAELYINGTSLGTRAVSQAYAETPGTFEAGASGSANNPFDGRLDEVAVYEHGLSAARIAAHHDAGRAPSGAAPGFDYRTALGGGAWSAWGPVQGSSVPVTDEGRTHLEARMSDVAGNVASTSETIKIDKADPTPSLDCPPAPEWSTTDVTCTVSGEDSVYSDAIQTDAPSLQWRLGEGSGTVAADASGHGHAGTYNGGHTLGQSGALAGSSDPASDFDGTNGRVNSTYNPFANGGQITIEGWANRDTSTTDDSLFGGNGSAPPRLLISAGSNDVRFRPVPSNGAEQLWTNAWPGTGQWVHWAVVLSESTDTAELFINGASKGTRTVSQAYATTPGSFEAGASGSTNNPFDGRLDEVAVYEHGLSAARIAAHHDAGLGSGFVSQKRTQTNGGVWLSWSSVAGSSFPITAEGTTQVEARVSGNDASVSGSASQTVKIDKSTP